MCSVVSVQHILRVYIYTGDLTQVVIIFSEMPMLDSIGSLSISVMLGAVSVFLFKTNADRLLGKYVAYFSYPSQQRGVLF